jgi:hypothetical protein
LKRGGGRIYLVIDPVIGLLFLDNPKTTQIAEFPLNRLKRNTCLEHDLSLLECLSSMGINLKAKDN